MVGGLYIQIFRQTFRLNKKKSKRVEFTNRLLKNSMKNNNLNQIYENCSIQLNSLTLVTTEGNFNNIEFREEQKSLEEIRPEKLSIKLRKMSVVVGSIVRIAITIFFVTMVYYLSIIPWILTVNNIIKFNPFIYYTFILNSSLNPLIYFLFNTSFRNHCIEFFKYLFVKNPSNEVEN